MSAQTNKEINEKIDETISHLTLLNDNLDIIKTLPEEEQDEFAVELENLSNQLSEINDALEDVLLFNGLEYMLNAQGIYLCEEDEQEQVLSELAEKGITPKIIKIGH